MSIQEKVINRARNAGLSLPEPVVEALIAYFELLRKWNRKVSLTSLPVEQAGEEAIDRILIEPLIASKYLPESCTSMLDVGSGGGSPAIPMKVAVGGLSLRMVESRNRKAAFLREAVRVMELERTTVDAVRFEDLLDTPGLGAFDVVTLRAVRIDAETLARVESVLKPGGLIFLFGTAAPAISDVTPSSLSSVGSHLLLDQWGSYLQILRKEVA